MTLPRPSRHPERDQLINAFPASDQRVQEFPVFEIGSEWNRQGDLPHGTWGSSVGKRLRQNLRGDKAILYVTGIMPNFVGIRVV